MTTSVDTPDHWARVEADEVVREYPDRSPAELADGLRQSIDSYDGEPEQARLLIAELQRRANAGVRLWPGPKAALSSSHSHLH